MKLLFPIIIFLVFPLSGKACFYASQHKVFPAGTKGNVIYTIDYKLVRTENIRIKSRYKINVPENAEKKMEAVWLIYGTVAEYDSRQNKIKETPMDTSWQVGMNYKDSLSASYSRILNQVKINYPDLDFFAVEYISFCDYQLECSKVSVSYDSISETNYIHYKKKEYEISVFKDTTLINENINPFFQAQIDHMRINSVRIYKNKSTEMVILFMASGDYIYEYTSDKKRAGETNDDGINYILSKEHKPDFKFKSIENGTYPEPVMHHGFGLDLFIVK